jgi:hypothetical protein
VGTDLPRTLDPVARAIDEVNTLLSTRRVDAVGVARWLARIESLNPRELVRFDQQARAYYSGVRWSAVQEPTRWRRPSAAATAAWSVLAMSSPDGHQRERAIRTAALRPLVVRLVVLRCVDWVAEVRTAALERLDAVEPAQLLSALSLAEQLATERGRGEILSSSSGAFASNWIQASRGESRKSPRADATRRPQPRSQETCIHEVPTARQRARLPAWLLMSDLPRLLD